MLLANNMLVLKDKPGNIITTFVLCSMHTYRLAVGSWRYRQLPTENRRSSVGVY